MLTFELKFKAVSRWLSPLHTPCHPAKTHTGRRWIDSYLIWGSFKTTTFLSHPVCESVSFYFQASHHSKTISSAHCPDVYGSLSFLGSLFFSSFAQHWRTKWITNVALCSKKCKFIQVQQLYPSNEEKMYSKILTLWPQNRQVKQSIRQLQNCNSIILQRGSQRKALEFITCFFDPCRARALAVSPVL